MAKARTLVRRRASIRNLRKITRTMNLIATTRYQKNLKRIASFRPFAAGVRRALGAVLAACLDAEHPLLRKHEPGSGRVVLVVLTSNRGLCGGYNGNVLRAASAFIADEEAGGREVELHVLGHKGAMYFGQRGRTLAGRYEAPGSAGVPEYGQVAAFAKRMMERYGRGDVDGVYVALTRFLSPGRQPNEVVRFLPVPVERLLAQGEAADGDGGSQYELSPGPGELLDYLLPAAMKVSMFQAVLEAATSEQFTRMISMKNATDSADRLIKSLTMRYNRARQSQITTELCEIMGAVEAMR